MDDKFNLDDFLKDAKLVDPPKMDLDDVWKQSNFQNPFGNLLPDMRNVPNAHDDIEKVNALLKAQVENQREEINVLKSELSKTNDRINELQNTIAQIRNNTTMIKLFDKRISLNTRTTIIGILSSGLLLNLIWWFIEKALGK